MGWAFGAKAGEGKLKWILLSIIVFMGVALVVKFPFYLKLFKSGGEKGATPESRPAEPLKAAFTQLASRPETGPVSVSSRSQRWKEWGRDPFSEAPSETKYNLPESTELSNLLLTGILFHGDRRVAILDHTLVHEGDTVQGAQVLRIEKDRVVLKRGEKETAIRIMRTT